MKIISFAYTTPAVYAGRKTVTRRQWRESYAARWWVGERFQAYDRSPRFGGRCFAVGLITSIALEPMASMPDTDFEAEGFAYLAEISATPPRGCPLAAFTMAEFRRWRETPGDVWVIRWSHLWAAGTRVTRQEAPL